MLNQLEPEEILKDIPNLEKRALEISGEMHKRILEGGPALREKADLLHGTWLGHPLHPVLTDITIGAWVFGSFFDMLGLITRSRGLQKAADSLVAIGTISAVPTALSGMTDFSTIPRKAVATGVVHGLINLTGFVLNLASVRHRRKGRRGRGTLLTLFSQVGLLVAAWLGGEMTFHYKVGVNHIPLPHRPRDWTPAMDDIALPERSPQRVNVGGYPILLYRLDGVVFAMGAVCGHEGAPLEKGDFAGRCVTCPWHQSVYNLEDGSVVHGPATYAAPSYEVRVENGKIEVRLKENLPARMRGKEMW